MGIEIIYAIVIVLLLFAVFDIVVGVSNDAVNFLNSAIGSRVAPFFVIMIIASLGILFGVAFSGGMMEVARKGIFHPQFFTMPELITIFMAVMFADIMILDLFNTYGLPTSTTVSIVFELLGATVALALYRVLSQGGNIVDIASYINTSKAMVIIFGILLSIFIAFCVGSVVQFITRLIFTFDFERRLKRYGAIWGGIAMALIAYFILINGIKSTTFINPEISAWIKIHYFLMMGIIFIFSLIVFQVLMLFMRFNILKIIVLAGTFALAMAFASNDLVNFIGVPLAGLQSFQIAVASSDPMNITMEALGAKVHSQNIFLIMAGVVMVLTLWFSKKARTVTDTEIKLGQQDEGTENYDSIWISRKIVSMVDSIFSLFRSLLPLSLREAVNKRINPANRKAIVTSDKKPSFDMLRASVNLMVASAIISCATSMKLPLSTTYVTFMVAMGTSFADQAWGRESAVYRVTGVLTVIGGWFITALVAFVIAFLFAYCISSLESMGIILLVAIVTLVIYNNHKRHKTRSMEKMETEILNLKKVTDPRAAISITFDHLSILIREFRECFDTTTDALFTQNVYILNNQRKRIKKYQIWVNIIMANVFKVLRLQQKGDHNLCYKYAQTIRRLQKLSDGFRDIVLRSYTHIANKHKGLLDVQINELKEIKALMLDILLKVETAFLNNDIKDYKKIVEQYDRMKIVADQMNFEQIKRIQDNSSKTRLSILFYAIVGDCLMLVKQNIKLLEILNESFNIDEKLPGSYIDMDTY
ncbi:MAG: inorganic phosphate transporter [Deltaproteobacteria bacterium]|nr:inorganic phosphate transporter [Deltaproteobacteria bacterium]